MKKEVAFFLFALIFQTVLKAQDVVEVSLFSGMNGTFQIESGGNLPFWGYGYYPGDEMSLPAPLLRFDQGQDVSISMFNPSPEAHTIHLHGLDVDQVNDGVPQTSFYVFPNETGTYEFNALHPGTYLYHCHVTTTLHLTMGMYGLLLVDYAEDQLFEGSPVYQREYPFLFSDLEIMTNLAPTEAFPFHEIRPDYFMINGKSGTQLEEDTDQHVIYEAGENIALRLGNMAYSVTRVIFPEGLNPEVLMSDGRELPEPFYPDTLEIYPGERFSVILSPDAGAYDDIQVEYYEMLNKTWEHTNTIYVDSPTSANDPSTALVPKLYPNPVTDRLYGTHIAGEEVIIYDLAGNTVFAAKAADALGGLDVTDLAKGTYVLHSGEHRRLFVKE